MEEQHIKRLEAFLARRTAPGLIEEIKKLQRSPFKINIQKIADTLHIHRNTVSNNIDEMVELGILKKSGSGKYLMDVEQLEVQRVPQPTSESSVLKCSYQPGTSESITNLVWPFQQPSYEGYSSTKLM